METQELKEIMAWIKTTDLAEVCFKEGRHGFSFAAEGSSPALSRPAAAGGYFSNKRETVACAPGIGIFQWGEPGKPRVFNEGGAVGPGDLLGLVEAGQGRKLAITAPCAGVLKRVMVEGGQGVEFGQPLFIIEDNV